MITLVITNYNSLNFKDILINSRATLYFNYIFYYTRETRYIIAEVTWINIILDPLDLPH
jgi:hypothetical protein